MKIGNINIKYPLFLAPMSGITDQPFRIICKNMGASVVYTEFVSADGVIRENVKTLDMIKFEEIERPIGVQIFGNSPNTVSESAFNIYNKFKPDLIDINFGCPVPKVTKKGGGSAALKNLDLMQKIVLKTVNAVPDIPVTVKMRAGWDKDKIISTEAGLRLEKIGVKAITLHPRTTSQRFTGEANWELIKELKESVNIPVIGNGDINSVDDYKKMVDTTGCDAVMIARGALGNPWIFKELNQYIKNKDQSFSPSLKERIQLCRKHYELLKEDKNSYVCLNLTKKHFSWYLKGFNGAVEWRRKFMYSKTTEEVESLLEEFENYVS